MKPVIDSDLEQTMACAANKLRKNPDDLRAQGEAIGAVTELQRRKASGIVVKRWMLIATGGAYVVAVCVIVICVTLYLMRKELPDIINACHKAKATVGEVSK